MLELHIAARCILFRSGDFNHDDEFKRCYSSGQIFFLWMENFPEHYWHKHRRKEISCDCRIPMQRIWEAQPEKLFGNSSFESWLDTKQNFWAFALDLQYFTESDQHIIANLTILYGRQFSIPKRIIGQHESEFVLRTSEGNIGTNSGRFNTNSLRELFKS